MKLLFTPEALASFNELKLEKPSEAVLVREILKDILANPVTGNGSPTKLTGLLAGLWCRNYGVLRQIIYSFDAEVVRVFSIGKYYDIADADSASPQIIQTQYSEEEYRNVLAQMEANRGKGETPKVGIFWYSVGRSELFGVVSHPINDYSKANASDGRITCSELHEDVWKKEYYKQRFKGDGNGLFIGQYQDKPRGRVFYRITDDIYEIATGKWIQDYPHVLDLIVKEFNLPPERTELKYAIHWDIGHSWR